VDHFDGAIALAEFPNPDIRHLIHCTAVGPAHDRAMRQPCPLRRRLRSGRNYPSRRIAHKLAVSNFLARISPSGSGNGHFRRIAQEIVFRAFKFPDRHHGQARQSDKQVLGCSELQAPWIVPSRGFSAPLSGTCFESALSTLQLAARSMPRNFITISALTRHERTAWNIAISQRRNLQKS